MENQGEQSVLPQSNAVVQEPKSSKKKYFLLISVIVFILLALVVGVLFSNFNKKTVVNTSKKVVVEENSTNDSSFFKTSVSSNFAKLNIADFPFSRIIRGVARYKDSLWISGDGTLIEYDSKTNEIKRFSDPKTASCDTSIVIVGNFLYAPCRIFGTVPGELYPPYSIYKINLINYQVEKILDKKTGLENGLNLELYKDNDTVWIATFDGVGKLDTKDDSIIFYTAKLGIQSFSQEIHYGTRNILVDDEYVWAVVSANSYSTGGLSLFNKKTGEWTPFGPAEIRGSVPDAANSRIDFEGVKLTASGIQAAFREYKSNQNDILIEKEYSYNNKVWTLLSNNYEASGEKSDIARDHIEATYGKDVEYGKEDKDGLMQIYSPSGNLLNNIDGRAFLWKSNPVGEKIYLITGSTFDVFKKGDKFPKILLKFGLNLDTAQPHSTDPQIEFLYTEDSELGILIDPSYFPGFESPEIWGEMTVWVFDLKKDELIKKFVSNTKYEWRSEFGNDDSVTGNEGKPLRVNRISDKVTVFMEDKPILEYNTSTNSVNYFE